MNTKKILMVLTSHSALGDTGENTGFWVEEFASPYYVFADAGIDITLASVKGGQPPIDPKSTMADFQTAATQRFDQDPALLAALAATTALSDIDIAQYDGVFYPGGHGPLWDLTDNSNSQQLINHCLNNHKPVAAVCHASAVLLNVTDQQGEFVIKGKKVTGFSNSEEDAVQLSDVVPFMLEDELVKRGGDYQKGDDWGDFCVADGLLITGQNPASSASAAQQLLQQVNEQ